jgi:glutamate N-acetyltransferase/amino-acid N-acetyltransferase
MPVNYHPPTPEQLLPVAGVTLGTAAGRIKNWSRDDVILVSLDQGSRAAGVFTRNRFCAAPVIVCREHLANGQITRALLINAGNANAGTGQGGVDDARACLSRPASSWSACRSNGSWLRCRSAWPRCRLRDGTPRCVRS